MKLISLLAFFACYLLTVSSEFVEKGKRVELFELTDNEVPVIRISLPEEEYDALKSKAHIGSIPTEFVTNFSELIEGLRSMYEFALQILTVINVSQLFPGEDVTEIFPELNVNELGYPEYDPEEILDGMNLDPNNYVDYDFGVGNLIFDIASSNPNFDLLKIAYSLNKVDVDGLEDVDPMTLEYLKYFKIILNVETSNKSIDYKTKNATMTVEINGEILDFDKVTFSLGGKSTRFFEKPGFNLKIRGGKNLYGRTQLKLRSEYSEPTYLRTKLVSDIRHHLGLSTISSNYATLYINDDFLGFYVLRDAYKASWIESEYGEKDTSSLYKCDAFSYLSMNYSSFTCTNSNDDIKDNSELIEFLTALDQAQSMEEIEEFFEVDDFLTDMALDYLLGAWDHFIYTGQNYYMYKQSNGKWKYLPYDYDFDFGFYMDRVGVTYFFTDLPERTERLKNIDYPNLSYKDWIKPHHLTDILIHKDPRRFEHILKELVRKVFNPSVLYPHIDELKAFIRPYVAAELMTEEEKLQANITVSSVPITKLNKSGLPGYSFEVWDANSEFTTIKSPLYSGYGLKYWVLAKYRYMCHTYTDLECDPIYLDENYSYPIDKNVEFTGYDLGEEEEEEEVNYDETTTVIEEEATETETTIEDEEEIITTGGVEEDIETTEGSIEDEDTTDDTEEITDDGSDEVDSDSESSSEDEEETFNKRNYLKHNY